LPVGGGRVHGPAKVSRNCQSKVHITIDSASWDGLHGKEFAKVPGGGTKESPAVSLSAPTVVGQFEALAKGHDFSRAVSAAKCAWALAPEGRPPPN
jgi:hypothetical protein